MADKNSVVSTLLGHVTDPVVDWYAGITDDPSRRKQEHGNPSKFHFEHADSEQIARDAEIALLTEGLQGDTGGGQNPAYVYVCKK